MSSPQMMRMFGFFCISLTFCAMKAPSFGFAEDMSQKALLLRSGLEHSHCSRLGVLIRLHVWLAALTARAHHARAAAQSCSSSAVDSLACVCLTVCETCGFTPASFCSRS